MPFFVSQNDHFPFLKYLKLILACCVIPNYCGVRMPQFQIKFTSQGLCLNVIMRKWKVLNRLSLIVCLLLECLNVWCKSGTWRYIDATVSLAPIPYRFRNRDERKCGVLWDRRLFCFQMEVWLWFWSIFNTLVLCLQFSIFSIFFRWSKRQVCLAWISSRYLLSAGSPFSLLSSSLSALG